MTENQQHFVAFVQLSSAAEPLGALKNSRGAANFWT